MDATHAAVSSLDALPDGFAWLSRRHRGAIAAHFLKLDTADRARRFGGPRTDDELRHIAAELDFARDWFLGIQTLNGGLAGLVQARPQLLPQRFVVEAALSIDARFRGSGLARRLLETLVFAVHTLSAANVVTMARSARRERRELLAELGATGAGVAHEVAAGIRIEVDRAPSGPDLATEDRACVVRASA